MSDQDQVTLNIEGVDVSVPKGTTILEAAKRAGIVIPHYCYHPGLPIAGVCRMCLVEVEGVPTLQIGCATTVADGQRVHVYGEKALEARKSVLEFLLINHPLDCPICDQAGECELQNYVFREGRDRTRYTPRYAKRFNPVEDFGPDILYVPNRCILCTRCVRFMDHVAEEPVINVSERGDRAFIGIHPDSQLDHPWAGNVVDLCPVGSLISKDFLHKARAWEMDKTPSICTGCSQGCNVTLDTRSNAVTRIRPRVNLAVNKYFICDHGRASYKWMNRGDRIEAPLVNDSGALTATDWDHALSKASQIISGATGKGIALASPRASNEALFLANQLMARLDSVQAIRFEVADSEEPLPGVDNLALRRERTPNAAGARILGFSAEFETAVRAADGASLVLLLDEAPDGDLLAALERSANVIYVGTTMTEAARAAAVVLPMTNVAEEDGSFVNRDHRVQRYFQAKSGPGMARPAWWILGAILAELGDGEPLVAAEEAFELIARNVSSFSGLTYETVGYDGVMVEQKNAAEVSA